MKRSPLRRTRPVRRTPSSTGPTEDVRWLLWQRDGGWCVRCTQPATDLHHRRPRAAGGTSRPDTNSPANLISLCRPCHAWVETHRTDALAAGLLVLQNAQPARVPLVRRSRWVLLDDLGDVHPLTDAERRACEGAA